VKKIKKSVDKDNTSPVLFVYHPQS